MQELLDDVTQQAELLPATLKPHVSESLSYLADRLKRLNSGLKGDARKAAEEDFYRRMAALQAELHGDEYPP